MLTRLATPTTLWTTFVLTILMTFAFQYLGAVWSLAFLDGMSDPGTVRQAIADMSAEQRVAHAWITGTLDVAYPLTYAALFAGSVYCFFPAWGARVAPVFGALIVIDLVEGLVQILALTTAVDWIGAKALLTPVKTWLFLGGALLTVAGWLAWLIRRLRRSDG